MEHHAWGRTGLKRERCDIPDGGAPDLGGRVPPLRSGPRSAGGLDLAILGVGADGHVAYNMPGPVTLATHVTRLPDGLAASLSSPAGVVAAAGPHHGDRHHPRRARLLVLATGAAKATAVRALVRGPEDPRWPCSFLSRHPDMEVLLDPGAASAL
jgi:glucosamine-6-phosphate deaminase